MLTRLPVRMTGSQSQLDKIRLQLPWASLVQSWGERPLRGQGPAVPESATPEASRPHFRPQARLGVAHHRVPRVVKLLGESASSDFPFPAKKSRFFSTRGKTTSTCGNLSTIQSRIY